MMKASRSQKGLSIHAKRTRSLFISATWVAIVASGSTVTRAQAPAAPTFTRDIAPIFYKNCVSCHRPGEMAPMSLLKYEDARPFLNSIRNKVASGTMPPWHAEAPAGTFKNDRRLTQKEKDTIAAWVAGGGPLGDPKDLPPAPTFAQGWTIGTPDVVLTMSKAYEVPASGTITYQNFELPTNFPEDHWVQAIEIRPGARQVVHHVLAFATDPGGERQAPVFTPRMTGGAAALVLGRGGRPGRGAAAAAGGGLGGGGAALIATTAPGTNAMIFEPGQALLIRKGAVVRLQVHYTTTGAAMADQSSIGFVFARQAPKQQVQTAAFANPLFMIPPGAAHHQVDSAIEFNQDAHILALFPHTHLRGKDWEYRLVYPDGRSEVVLSVPHYDFNWQTYYEFAEPLAVPKGARLEATAHYDNSTANKANPNPAVPVRWGQQTWDEMQYTGLTFVVDPPKPATR